MPDNKQDPTRLELYKSGKIEGRRASRPPLVPEKTAEKKIEEDTGNMQLRPEVVILVLLITLLLIIAAIAV